MGEDPWKGLPEVILVWAVNVAVLLAVLAWK